MKHQYNKTKEIIRALIILFIAGLVLSGITAFPIETELKWLVSLNKDNHGWMSQWLERVYTGVKHTNEQFPFMAYGSDWLGFAHLVIAVVFIGPLMDPVRNMWVIEFGMIACLMIFPLAFIAGEIRQIPMAWRLIDCAFGAIGILPLAACYNKIKQLEQLQKQQS
jgi:hypothetical protein